MRQVVKHVYIFGKYGGSSCQPDPEPEQQAQKLAKDLLQRK